MDLKTRIKNLLSLADETEQVELKVVNNAFVENLKRYGADKTAAAKRDLDAAKDGLESLVEALEAKYVHQEKVFKNILEAVQHLKSQGYKIGKSKAYADRKKGLLRVQNDGSITESALVEYARTLAVIGDPEEDFKAAQREKLELETERLRKQNEGLQFDLDIKKGKYVLRQDADLSRAAALSVVEASLMNMAISCCGEWLKTVDGNPKKASLFIDAVQQGIRECFNRLTRMGDFEVVFDLEDVPDPPL